MPVIRACWYVVLLAALAHPAFPAIRPSLNLDYSSWHATHIVLVITTPTAEPSKSLNRGKAVCQLASNLSCRSFARRRIFRSPIIRCCGTRAFVRQFLD